MAKISIGKVKTVKRSDVPTGNAFMRVNDNVNTVYLAAGVRTAPPSGAGRIDLKVDGVNVYHSEGRGTGKFTASGKEIVGWNGLKLGYKNGTSLSPVNLKTGEDGAVFATDGDAPVIDLGAVEFDVNL